MSSKMGLVVALSLTSLTALYHLILYFFLSKTLKETRGPSMTKVCSSVIMMLCVTVMCLYMSYRNLPIPLII